VYETGTTPKTAVRAFVSNRSEGVILYQSRENGHREWLPGNAIKKKW